MIRSHTLRHFLKSSLFFFLSFVLAGLFLGGFCVSYAFPPCIYSSQKRNHKRKTCHLNIQGGEAAFFQHLVIYCLNTLIVILESKKIDK